MNAFIDPIKERLVFISKNDDEIHLLVEYIDGRLTFQPRWNVTIATNDKPKKYVINLNFPTDWEVLTDTKKDKPL